MIQPNLFRKYLARFDELIAEGEAMLQRIEVLPGKYYPSTYYLDPPQQGPEQCVFDRKDDFDKWQINYKLLLDVIIPSENSQRKLIDSSESAYFNSKTKLEVYLSVLKAVRDNYEKGLIGNSQSALSLFSLEDVGRLLRRVPAGLRQWTWENTPRRKGGQARQWHIDNEYHVQNLLYFLLTPFFRDLINEVHTSPVGAKNPRADLFIPSLELIIEVKFMRMRDTTQSIIEQIASDNSLYFPGNDDAKQLIPFIWDDSQRSEDHDLLISGIKKFSKVVDVVVISRPKKIAESKLSDEEPKNIAESTQLSDGEDDG